APTALPFTLVMLGGGLLLATLSPVGDGGPRPSWRALLGGWGKCLGGALLLALPHYALDWRHISGYIYVVLFSPDAEVLSISNGRRFPTNYYLTGHGGELFLGFHLAIFAALLAAGLLLLLLTRRRQELLRRGGVVGSGVAAWPLPTSKKISNPFFGLTFMFLLMFTALWLLRILARPDAVSPGGRRWAAALYPLAAMFGLFQALP